MNQARRTGFLLFTVLAVAVFLALSGWQLYRLQWKNRLIRQATAALAAKPVSLRDIEAGLENGFDVNILRTRLTGHYRHDSQRYVYSPGKSAPGYRVITPFIDNSGYMALVDRGWISQAQFDDKTRKGWRLPESEITITGITRAHARSLNLFTPPSDIEKNIWYSYDLAAMARSLPAGIGRMPDGRSAIMSSFFIQLEPGSEPGSGKWPQTPPAKIKFPNNHLQYAVTWFSLAVITIIMSVMFMRKG